MIDFIQKNVQVIIITLLAAGVILSIANAGTSNNTETTTDEAATTQTEQQTDQQAESTEQTTPQTNEQLTVSEQSYTATAVAGDNQTVLMRKVIDSYINETSATVDEVQKLYLETVIVNTLPRNDKIAIGQQFTVEKSTLNDYFARAKELTDAQRTDWARYL